MAETVSMAFLGMSIQCARCHDHPLEKWTNDDYSAWSVYLPGFAPKVGEVITRSGDGNRTIFSASDGELIQPRTGRPRLPRPLNGDSIAFDDPGDRRGHLVAWLTAPRIHILVVRSSIASGRTSWAWESLKKLTTCGSQIRRVTRPCYLPWRNDSLTINTI